MKLREPRGPACNRPKKLCMTRYLAEPSKLFSFTFIWKKQNVFKYSPFFIHYLMPPPYSNCNVGTPDLVLPQYSRLKNNFLLLMSARFPAVKLSLYLHGRIKYTSFLESNQSFTRSSGPSIVQNFSQYSIRYCLPMCSVSSRTTLILKTERSHPSVK